MRRFKVKVNMIQNGEIKGADEITCDVRGKDLSESEILKRLTNNVKTWQSAWNKGYYSNNKYRFKIIDYKEVK